MRECTRVDQSGSGVDLDEVSDDEEVFALDLPSDGDSSEEDSVDDEDDDDDDDDEEEMDGVEQIFTKDFKAKDELPKGRFAKAPVPSSQSDSSASSESSDSSDSSDSSNSKSDEEQEEESDEEEEEKWHPSSYHATRRTPGELNSDDSEADDEAFQLEVDEARRLQKKSRAGLDEDDFRSTTTSVEGVPILENVKVGKLEEEETIINEDNKSVEMTEETSIALLLKNNPETLALVDDFSTCSLKLQDVSAKLEEVRAMEEVHPSLPLLELENRLSLLSSFCLPIPCLTRSMAEALSTYLTNLTFYFSLLLQRHPSTTLVGKVLDRLAGLRGCLATMEELELTSAEIDDDDDLSELAGSEEEDEGEEIDEEDEESEEDVIGRDELAELLRETTDASSSLGELARTLGEKGSKKRPAIDDDDDEDEHAQVVSIGKGKKETKKAKKEPFDIFSLIPSLPPLAPRTLTPSRPSSSSASDYIEPTLLTSSDLAEKEAKKHSLRFHVSQVNQRAARREKARTGGMGGDEDLPRRSKERSRREVLKRQDHSAVDGGGRGEGRVGLDAEDWEDGERRVAGEVRGEDGYYELVKKGKEEGRERKKEDYDRRKALDRSVFLPLRFSGMRPLMHGSNRDELQTISSSSAAGPREANRQMLSNKGLTPRRAKINRNPRVKKRMQYAKAVKKVESMKPVFKKEKAREGREGYAGEKSGIAGKVVKSVRLG